MVQGTVPNTSERVRGTFESGCWSTSGASDLSDWMWGVSRDQSMKNREGGKDREHFKGEEHHPQYPRMREHNLMSGTQKAKWPGAESCRPYKTHNSTRLHSDDSEQKSDTINFRLLVDRPGEGRELTGGWQVWSQGKQQKLFRRREVTFLDSVAMEIERRQGLWFCVGLGLTVTLSTIMGPVQSQCLRNSKSIHRNLETTLFRP